VDIYTRASRAGDGSTTHEVQERQARDFARSKGLTIGRVLRDETKSSSGTLARPVLQEALRRVKAGESGGIVVVYLSRASRDTRQGLELLETIAQSGGAVYAPNLPDYTTGDGAMLTTIQFAIDTGYRVKKNEEFERAKAGSIASGIPVHTRPPVGYRKRRDKRLEPNPRTAPVVREVFERRAQGEGPTELAQLLEARGVKTSQGSRTWSKQAIYGLLANETYMGVLSYGRDRRYVNSNGIEQPIVDAAMWHAAQHPDDQRVAPARSAGSPWLLTGILRCQSCRYCLQGTLTSRGKRIYRCNRRHAGGLCPSPTRIDAASVEAAAVEAFWALTNDLEAQGTQDDGGELAGLETAFERAGRLLNQLEDPQAQDALGDRYLTIFRERCEQHDRAAERLGRARAAAGTPDVPSSETLRGAWERMAVQDRRELLSLRFHCLALGRDRTLVVYPAGTDVEFPTRGFRRAPGLEPFPAAPAGARTLALAEAS
jgi:site-specific DNA recombinase